MPFVEQTSRQINFCAKIFTICFFFVEETFNHALGKKVDHVLLMFISEHQCKYVTQNKCLQILFFPEACIWLPYLFEEI